MWAHCQVKLRLVNTAIRDGFQSVIDYWPESHEAVVSTLMIGKCHLLNGEPSKADKIFAQVADEYSKHSLATLSRVEMLGIASARKDKDRQVELWTDIAYKTPKTKETASYRASSARSLATHFFQENEFQKGSRRLRPITTTPAPSASMPCTRYAMRWFPGSFGFPKPRLARKSSGMD